MSRALVFVGGFAAPGNEWPLTPIRRRARDKGWRTKYFNERLAFGPLTTSAERLVKFTEHLAEAHDTIVVVGHSMGVWSQSTQQHWVRPSMPSSPSGLPTRATSFHVSDRCEL